MNAPYADRIRNIGISSNPIDHTKTSIVQALEKWKELDDAILSPPQTSSSSGVRTKIDVPRSVFLATLEDLKEEDVLADCQFDRLSRQNKLEYTHQLAAIFASIPKFKGEKDGESDAQDNIFLKYNALAADVEAKPELEIPAVKLEQAFLQGSEKLYVLGLYNPRSQQLQQRVEILGCQTLYDLQQTLYCVQDSYPSQDSQPPIPFFFLKSTFYEEQSQHNNTDENPAWRHSAAHQVKAWLLSKHSRWGREQPHLPQQPAAGSGPTVTLLPRVHQQSSRKRRLDSSAAQAKSSDLVVNLDQLSIVSMSSTTLDSLKLSEVLSAEFIVYHDRLASDSSSHIPTFLCKDCHHMLHYGLDNQLLYDDFLVYPYFHDNA
eukprot:gene29270-35337_t